MAISQPKLRALRQSRTTGELDLRNPHGDLSPARMRTGLILLLTGSLLMLGVLIIGTIRLRGNFFEAANVGSSTGLDPNARNVSLNAYLIILVAGGLLLMLFLFAAYALIRGNRRYQEFVGRKPRKPTESEDVWAMHRVPTDRRDHDHDDKDDDDP